VGDESKPELEEQSQRCLSAAMADIHYHVLETKMAKSQAL